MPIAAVDTETYYDKEVSVVPLGIYHYLRHPASDIYLVSISTDTGLKYTGSPWDFDWNQINGPEWTFLSHNASFDQPVFTRIQELAKERGLKNVPENLTIKAWHDTADLAAFLGYPRSLKESCFHLLDISLSKDVRDKMKGQRWETMTPEFQAEVCQYAQADADNCLELFLRYGDQWPEHEREYSRMTREMGIQGVPLDLEGLERDIQLLDLAIYDAQLSIPWRDSHPILSAVAMRAECEKQGMWQPDSFAQDDPDAERWENEYADKYPWVKAVRSYRKANKHRSTLKTMLQRHRGDGWMSYGLKYAGAHTLRDSGEAGLNMQNIPKGVAVTVNVNGEDHGIYIREKIQAPEGYTFVISDLSQIEPRVLHWLAGDTKTLEYIKQIPDLYEAQARAWGVWDEPGQVLKDDAPEVRHMMKQLALGLGYGMGAFKFATVAGVLSREAERLVNLYRDKNPKILAYWKRLETAMRSVARNKTTDDRTCSFAMHSGRLMNYRNVAAGDGLSAEIPRLGKMMRLKFWGGVLTENRVQATARDVFMYQCKCIKDAGYNIIMRVHDEVVCLVKEEEAEAALNHINSLMATTPPWAKGLPLAAEGKISKTYTK